MHSLARPRFWSQGPKIQREAPPSESWARAAPRRLCTVKGAPPSFGGLEAYLATRLPFAHASLHFPDLGRKEL